MRLPTHFIKYVCNICYRRHVFCKPIQRNSMAIEVFKISDDFFNDYYILWEKCFGLCADKALSMSGVQAVVQKVAGVWTHCMIQTLDSRDMGGDLLTVFGVIIKIVNFIKNSLFRERVLSKV